MQRRCMLLHFAKIGKVFVEEIIEAVARGIETGLRTFFVHIARVTRVKSV